MFLAGIQNLKAWIPPRTLFGQNDEPSDCFTAKT